MAKYINREALPQKKERGFFLEDDFNAGWNACLNNIESIPAADVAPVRHGKWIFYDANDLIDRCSLCGEERPSRMFYRSNYCPNCGARMDGDTK